MPRIDVKCSLCGITSEVDRAIRLWPATPPCPRCDGPTEQIHLPHQPSYCPAVVAYQMPDGSFRFPGDPNSPSTHAYESQGGTRLELRGWAEVRRFEKVINDRDRSLIARRIESQRQAAEEGTSRRRSELRRRMSSMSDAAQKFGRALIAFNDAKPSPHQTYDPGFYVDCYSNDRSNREESRDSKGRKRHD